MSGYGTVGDGQLFKATALATASDLPAPAAAVYYLVRPLTCGSWQSTTGVEPGRDAALP